MTIARAGDIYGRKPVFLSCLPVTICAFLGILISKSYLFDYCCLFVLGTTVAGRYYVGYTYLIEMMPKDKQVIVGTFLFSYEAAAYMLVCAYFYKVKNHWHFIFIPTIGLASFGSAFMLMFPESPRWLLS